MGRAPCCDKTKVKKGPWSPEEDATLKSYIDQNGTGNNWIALPQKIGLKRCGKSCRLRWLNYLRPNLKHGGFSEEEDNIICSLYVNIGSRWSIIAAQLPGRTDNDIKNYWNTRLKKKLLGKHRKVEAHQANSRQNAQKRVLNNQYQYQYPQGNTIPTSSPFVGVIDHHHHHDGLIESGQVVYWPDLKPVLTPAPLDLKPLEQQQGAFQSGLETLQAELSELINYKNYQQEEVLSLEAGNYPASINTNNNSEGFYENIGGSTATSAASFDSSIESSYFAYNYVENALPHHQQDYSGFDDQDQLRCYFGTT